MQHRSLRLGIKPATLDLMSIYQHRLSYKAVAVSLGESYIYIICIGDNAGELVYKAKGILKIKTIYVCLLVGCQFVCLYVYVFLCELTCQF